MDENDSHLQYIATYPAGCCFYDTKLHYIALNQQIATNIA